MKKKYGCERREWEGYFRYIRNLLLVFILNHFKKMEMHLC